jgi:hypothetical protein
MPLRPFVGYSDTSSSSPLASFLHPRPCPSSIEHWPLASTQSPLVVCLGGFCTALYTQPLHNQTGATAHGRPSLAQQPGSGSCAVAPTKKQLLTFLVFFFLLYFLSRFARFSFLRKWSKEIKEEKLFPSFFLSLPGGLFCSISFIAILSAS